MGDSELPSEERVLEKIEPTEIRRVWQIIREQVREVTDTFDRRGFKLQHWQPSRPNANGKPCELSLEHEFRLAARDIGDAEKLLDELYRNEGNMVRNGLMPSNEEFGGLTVRKYRRLAGPQSVDRYYDVDPLSGEASLVEKMITVRERLITSKFMTWSAENEGMTALNVELPFIRIGQEGMTVRLEFNWIDDFAKTLSEIMSEEVDIATKKKNPLYLALTSQKMKPVNLVPVLLHTTYRQKFGVYANANDASSEDQRFAINVDLMVAQDLRTHRIGCSWDVDVSGVRTVDEAEFGRVMRFGTAIASRFNLQPNPGTKAWRDGLAVGYKPRL